MEKKKPTAGDYVIVNDFDRPESRHIVHIDRTNDDGSLTGHYVNIEYPVMVGINPDEATLVSDFGYSVRQCGGRLMAVPTGEPSVATYRNGDRRYWQE